MATPPSAAPRMTHTTHGVGMAGKLFHWTMILCTAGLWYPVYHKAKRTSRHHYA